MLKLSHGIVICAFFLSGCAIPVNDVTSPGMANMPGQSFNITLNGTPFEFTIDQTTYDQLTSDLGTPLIENDSAQGKTLLFAYYVYDTNSKVFSNIITDTYTFDNNNILLSWHTKPNDESPDVLAALQATKQGVAGTDPGSRQKAELIAYGAAQRALMVQAMSSRCDWDLNASVAKRLDEAVNAYRPFINQFDFDVMVSRGVETSPVDTNELCLTPSWRQKYDLALASFK